MQMEVQGGSWATVADDCPITYVVRPDMVELCFGSRATIELSMSTTGLRRLVATATAAYQEAERRQPEDDD
ncbi:hypothetical protein L6E12_05850 [Actinokineospora sp. PR83]|uniref:hypothetical protein n=1 Tax=Actinokineospora sp. PR83 TaxID=2884908 RepID=UPI001F339707|nr:hypothetical protein [Actinokineospora sp. PR83]MCG8915314.1 hypothetical protein [Actinokineospora sp. PR83]